MIPFHPKHLPRILTAILAVAVLTGIALWVRRGWQDPAPAAGDDPAPRTVAESGPGSGRRAEGVAAAEPSTGVNSNPNRGTAGSALGIAQKSAAPAGAPQGAAGAAGPGPVKEARRAAPGQRELGEVEEEAAGLLMGRVELSDPQQRAALVARLRALEDEKTEVIRDKAKRLGLPTLIVDPDGTRLALVGFDGDRPLYEGSHNANAAISSAANLVRTITPFQANGAGLVFGLWEAQGIPRVTHQEFGLPTKVTVRDGYTTVSNHATHVAGTLTAIGIDPGALGMAPMAAIDAYEASNAASEMLAAGASFPEEPGKIYLSNHSYGFRLGWDPATSTWLGTFSDDGNPANDIDTVYGRYDTSVSVLYDAMLFNLPYYLPFWSSGNDRSDTPPASGQTWFQGTNGPQRAYDPAQHPVADGVYKAGYDLLTGTYKSCKNVMTIGAANDAVTSGVRDLAPSTLTSFSSTGPTDDGRIKPDIVGNGAGLYSSGSLSDTNYYSSSGTSMAAPNACGSAMLLIDYYGQRFPGEVMRASTLKGLIIHTADDIGRAGPDYQYGWGLMNTKAAADIIRAQADRPFTDHLVEDTLQNGGSQTYTIVWDGTQPIRATLCWTDPAGTGVSAHDDRTPDLVNDLNLSITGPGGTTHLPFVMPYVGDWSNAALTALAVPGVNTVDNVEQVLISNPPAPGIYTVTVDHVGSLSEGQQTFSLILTGHSDPRPIITSPDTVAGVAGQPFSHQITTSVAAESFSLSGSLPSGLTLNPVTGQISGTPQNGGVFPVDVTATNAAGSDTQTLTINIVAPATVPLFEDFENSLGTYWEIGGTNAARTVVSAANEPYRGLRHLLMDSSTNTTLSRNELTLTINLPPSGDLQLSFWAKEFGDEAHGPPTVPFTSGADFDGVAISADGTTWYEVQPLRSEISAAWRLFSVDLGAAITSFGLPRGNQFRIRFNHYDDFSIPSDGFAFDDIRVGPPLPLITSAATFRGGLNQLFSHQITTSSPATSFAVSSGTLPPGLTLSASGLISGTAEQAGTFTFGITAANANGSDTQSIQVTIVPGSLFSYSNASFISIPSLGNASPYPSTIQVTGLLGSLVSLRVGIQGLTHSRLDDLDLFLMAPSGQVCALMSDAGGTNVGTALNLVFDDAAAAPVSDSTAILSGTYRPANYEATEPLPPGGTGTIGTSLQALTASPAAGTWSLFVSDDTDLSGGSILSWSLELVINSGGAVPNLLVEQPEGSGLVSGSDTVSFGSIPLPSRSVRRFVLRNTGEQVLNLSNRSISGTHAADFVPGSLNPSLVAPGALGVLDVTFTPSATGLRQAVLTINSTDPDTPMFTINLSGSGAALGNGVQLVTEISASLAGFSSISQPLSMGSYVLFYATTPLLGTEVWRSDGTAAGTYPLRDFVPGPQGISFSPLMERIGDLAYFVAEVPSQGSQLWVTDGTPGGTRVVSDLSAGVSLTTPTSLVAVGSTLFFTAFTSSSGRELWKTDGTAAGTVQVADIFPGSFSSTPGNLVNLNGTLLFSATGSTGGAELWRSDGTSAGTQLVLDINSGGSSSSPSSLRVVGNQVFFTATTAANGSELWKTNGTTAGTTLVRDIVPGTSGSFVSNMIANGSVLYFTAITAEEGTELWRSDGTTIGTTLVKDIEPGSSNGLLSPSFTVFNGELYFAAITFTEGIELWKSDGTSVGTVLIKDIAVGGASSSSPALFRVSGGILYFVATSPEGGRELWKTDGTNAGTVQVRDIFVGTSSSSPIALMDLNGLVLFTADDGATGRELWRSQGTAPTTFPLGDLAAGTAAASPSSLRNIDGTLFFAATDSTSGTELWRSGGTTASTTRIKDIISGLTSSSPTGIAPQGAKAIFAASATGIAADQEPHVSDGTSAGTFLLADIVTTSGQGSSPTGFTSVGNKTVFSATNNSTFGSEPWVTDGTTSGTSLLLDINQGIPGSSPTGFFAFKGKIYFRAQESLGAELWVTDGTTAGTRLVKDIAPGLSSSSPANFAVMNGELYFSANRTEVGTELWKTDGTDDGTVLVADIYPGGFGTDPSNLTAVGSTLFFTATGTSGGTELWKSDGTAQGTVMVRDIRPGSASSSPASLAAMGGILYFTADDGVNGRELWRSDGTADGTFLLQDIWPGASASSPTQLVRMGDILYFLATDDDNGTELWMTDGTAVGTNLAADIFPGELSSFASSLTAVGPRLFFSAMHPATGPELFSVTRDLPAQLQIAQPAGTLHPPGGALNLGTVAVGSSKTITLSLTNGGTNRLAISNVSLSGRDFSQFQIGALSSSVLFGNDEALLELVHVPTSIGRKTATLTFTSDDPSTPAYSITVETPKLDQTINFASIPDQMANATVLLSATGGGSGNPVTFSVDSGPATLTGGNLLSFTGAGEVAILASQAGNEDYNGAPGVIQRFQVSKAMALVSLESLTQSYNGMPRVISATTVPAGLPVEFTYNGTPQAPVNRGTYPVTGTINHPLYQGAASGFLTVTIATQEIVLTPVPDQVATATVLLSATGGTSGNPITFALSGGPGVLTGGNVLSFLTAGVVSITASQAGDGNHEPAPNKVLFINVAKATAPISLAPLNQTYNGSARTVTATTSPPGLTTTLTYAGGAQPPVDAGSYAIVATIDDLRYQGSATGTLVVAKASQTIDFPTIPTQTATATVLLAATGGSSGNPVTFAVTSGPGQITGGNSLSFSASGQVIVTASQAGNANYAAASDLARTVNVTKAAASISLGSLQQTYDGTARIVTATTTPPNLTVNITYAGSSHPPVNVGSYPISATINDSRYQGTVTGTLAVSKASQTIQFPSIPDPLATATVVISATGGDSGNPVTFAVTSGPGVLTDGNSLSFTASGEVIVTASQAGNANYAPAAAAPLTLNVLKAEGSITLSALNQTYDGTARSVTTATTPPGLQVNLTYAGLAQAPVDVGSYAVEATINDLRYTGSATGTLNIAPASQSIDFPPIADQIATATVNLSATGGISGNPVVFTVTEGPGSIAGDSVLTFTGTGLVRITASQPGGSNFAPAQEVVRSFVVTPDTSVVALAGLYQEPDGTPRPATVVTVPPGLTIEVTYNGSLVPPVEPGTYAVTATVQDPRYEGQATGTLVLDSRAGKDFSTPSDEVQSPQGIDEIWVPEAAGSYEGFLVDVQDKKTIVGMASLTISPPRRGATDTGGLLSGTVRLNRANASLRGSLGLDGRLIAALPQRFGGHMVVDLGLVRTGEGRAIRGTVSWNNLAATADLVHSSFNARSNPVPARLAATGLYTVLLPSQPGWGNEEPGGDGWATASLSPSGSFALSGQLGDGTSFTEKALLSGNGQMHVYSELYASSPGKGRIAGRVTFRSVAQQPGGEILSDCDGKLTWHKGKDTRVPPREPLYPDDFRLEVSLVGSRFTPPPKGTRVLAFADVYRNAELSLIGPTAPTASSDSADRVVSWFRNNEFVHHGHHRLSGSASARNGSVKGEFVDPGTLAVTRFNGVAFQRQNLVGGVFVRNDASGAVRIEPQVTPYESAPGQLRVGKPTSPPSEPPPVAAVDFNPTQMSGLYHGLLTRTDAVSGAEIVTGALENLRIAATGVLTATLWIDGTAYRVRGTMPRSGPLDLPVARGTLPPAQLRVGLQEIVGSPGAYRFTGSVTVDNVEHTLSGQRQERFTASNRCPQEGAYTFVICSEEGADPATEPAGDGYGTLLVSSAGACSGRVTLADGTTVSLGGFVGRSLQVGQEDTAEWICHHALPGRPSKGYVAGRLTFRRDATGPTDLDGTWRWAKRAGTALASGYPHDLAVTLPVVGCRYTAPSRGARAMSGLAEGFGNVWLRFTGPPLEAGSSDPVFARRATWTSANKLSYPGPETISTTFNARTGLLTGRCVDAFTGINVRFGGVLLQEQNLVSGSYLNGAFPGHFGLQAK